MKKLIKTCKYNIPKVLENFNATRFCNEFQIPTPSGAWSEDSVSVFYTENPLPGHEQYFYLREHLGKTYVNGLKTYGNILANGIHCEKCDEVIRSTYRHDYVTCSCGNASVDGGRDYFKFSGENISIVAINLLTDEII